MCYNDFMNTDKTLNTILHTKLVSLAETLSGFSASEVTGYSPEQVRRAAEALVRAGRIVRSAVSPRRIRYFANDQLARNFAAGKAKTGRSMSTIGPRTKAPWRADEPGLITPLTKIYVAPPLPRNVFRTNTYSQF